MTITLPDMPARIARLPRDERGYPVPRFVPWVKDGEFARRLDPLAKPEFRYADPQFRSRAFHHGLCWVCGERLGVHKVYGLGPMCVVNRITSEPAMHRDCAEWSARACPFLIHPREKRNEKNINPIAGNPGGLMIKRNPGCVALYETPIAKAIKAGDGWLIKLGDPDRVDWLAEGRQATREEVLASIDSGYPILFAEAKRDGLQAIHALGVMRTVAQKLLPA
jgi:hypothetical protein